MKKVQIVTEFYTLDVHSEDDEEATDEECAVTIAKAIIFTNMERAYVRSLAIEVWQDDVFNKELSEQLTDLAYQKED